MRSLLCSATLAAFRRIPTPDLICSSTPVFLGFLTFRGLVETRLTNGRSYLIYRTNQKIIFAIPSRLKKYIHPRILSKGTRLSDIYLKRWIFDEKMLVFELFVVIIHDVIILKFFSLAQHDTSVWTKFFQSLTNWFR